MKLFVAFLAFLALAQAASTHNRVKRASLSNCDTTPSDMDDENVVDDSDTMSLRCNTDQKVLSCVWRHTDPISEKEQGSSSDPTILCSGGIDSNGQTCQDDTRVTFRTSETSCAIDVSNTEPKDTGKWTLSAMTMTSSGSTQNSDKIFEVYTYNQSQLFMLDEDLNTENSLDTTYNYDTKEEEWVSGKNGWESVEMNCMAYGGRPLPTFLWYVDNNDNDDLEDDNHFDVSTGSIGSDYDYIENYQSNLKFGIDDTLLEKLDDYGIDTNPGNGMITFEITCEVQQGLSSSFQQRERMRINIQRPYDDGNLKASTIGIIVGVIIAVILLVVAIGVLVFAKASNRWCFAEDDYNYNDPANPKSHPRNQGRGPGPPSSNQQAQRQHR